MKSKIQIIIFVLLFSSSCTSVKKLSTIQSITTLKFLGEYTIPYNFQFKNTTVGGLSGIDYDSKKDVYYFISDDRSDNNPARFYTAKLKIKDFKIDTVLFLETTFLKTNVGKNYPNSRENPFEVPDPEALRYNAKKNNFIWSSEGERIVNNDTILLDPAIIEIDRKGNFLDSFSIPPNFRMQATDNGPRRNGVFEGLTFSGDYRTLYISTEEPLYEDGPRAGLNDTSGITRIIKYNVANKKAVGQYAYRIDPVAFPPIPTNGFKVNGVTDILWINKNQLLVVERSYSVGRISNTVKVFLTSLKDADNIENRSSLTTSKPYRAASKELLLNMDSLKILIDNIEGVTFGPILPNGKKTLIFVSDNNFNPLQRTQLLLFEIN